MKQEGLKYLVEQGEAKQRVFPVHDDGETVTKLVFDGTSFEMETFKKEPVKRCHKFVTIDGFCDFMNSSLSGDHAKKTPVFVGESFIVADLAYGYHTHQRAEVPIKFTEEFGALHNLSHPTDQKTLWRSLITELSGKIGIPGNPDPEDKTFLQIIQSLKVSSKTEGENTIELSGLESGGRATSISITFPGKQGQQTTTIPLDWEFRGQIYRCFPYQSLIQLRLEITQEIKFILHQIELSSVFDDITQKIVAELKNLLHDNCIVFEGEIS